MSLLLLNIAQEQFGKLDNGVIAIEGNQSVDDTVFSLRMALVDEGFAIPLEIEFGADAASGRTSQRQTTFLVTPVQARYGLHFSPGTWLTHIFRLLHACLEPA